MLTDSLLWRRHLVGWGCALLLASSAAGAACPARIHDAGIGFEAQRAGLQEGDCVMAWRRGDSDVAQPLTDALTLQQLEFEQAPQGNLQLQVEHNGALRWQTMASGNWGIDVLPALPVSYQRALYDWSDGRSNTPSRATWPPPPASLSARDRAALGLWRVAQLETGDGTVDDLLAAAARPIVSDAAASGMLALLRCSYTLQNHQLDSATELCNDAVMQLQRAGLPHAALRARAALLQVQRQAQTQAPALALGAVLALQAEVEAALPDSLLRVSVLLDHAVLLRQLDRLDESLVVAMQAQAQLERLGSADRLRLSLANLLGLLQRARGDLDAAQESLLEAVAIGERIAPDSLQLARDLNNLGLLQWDRTNMAQALATFERSLAIKRRRGATPLDLAATLSNLALLALPLGRIDQGQHHLDEALAIYRSDPPGLPLAGALVTAARLAEKSADPQAAMALYDEALALYRELAPDTLPMAWALHFKAGALGAAGNAADALRTAQQAVALQRRLSPAGRELGFGLDRLARLQQSAGDLPLAARSFDEAIAIRRRLAPASQLLAQSLHGAGTVAAARKQLDRARTLYCEAVSTLEQQRWRWSRQRDDLLELGRDNAAIYRDCAVALLDSGDATGAFDVLEQSRARLLLDSLSAHRDELLATLPASTAAAWRALQTADRTLDAAQLESRHSELARQLQTLAPAQSALLLARPLRWAQLRTLLPDYTTILSQFHDGERFWVVLARADQATPQFIAVPEPTTAILRRARGLTALAGNPGSNVAALEQTARWLEQRLVAPAAAQLRQTRQLLLVPDPQFSLLPFAALLDRRERFLVQRFSLRQSASLSLSATTVGSPASHGPGASPQPGLTLAVAVGGATSLSPAMRARWRGGALPQTLPELPGAIAEARAVAGLYGADARLLLGDDATEQAVRTLAVQARHLHFAVHGLIDPQRPLDSALLLADGSGAPEDDGLLSAADLITQVPLRADLVAVSACDLGGGQVDAGEGLLGLRHALHAAGAREVVSSLWPVADASGALLMTQFYRELRRDQSSDRALQLAQQSMLRQTRAGDADQATRGVGGLVRAGQIADRTHPFYWAGFVLDGGLD